MNTIVIAAIALLVLVVIAAIFLSEIGRFRTQDCEVNGGVCIDDNECGDGYTKYNRGSCYDSDGRTDDRICCLPVPG